jgi:uncharacterized protein
VNGDFELTTHALVAMLLTIILTGIVVGARRRVRFLQRLATDPRQRSRFYRRFIINSWIVAAFVPAIVLTSAHLSAADLGWAWPTGDGLDYLLALYLLVMIGIGGVRMRRRMRRGQAFRGRAVTALIVPQTAHERWLAATVAFTAGVTEEMVYRGLLIATGTRLYHLPLAVVVVASLALFVAQHTYQGPRGMFGVAVLGVVFTTIYLMSGSLLLPIVVHVFQNLVALLVVPAHPTVPATADGADARPAAEAAGAVAAGAAAEAAGAAVTVAALLRTGSAPAHLGVAEQPGLAVRHDPPTLS